MMDITVKIIFEIVPVGLEEGEVEVKVIDLGTIIIIMIVDNPKTKIPKEEEEVIKVGEGDVDITHSKVSIKHMTKATSQHKDNILIWHHPKCNPKI